MNVRNIALAAVFVGPTAAALDLAASYYLVYPAQGSGSKWPLHVVTVVAAVITIAGVLMSRRVLARKDATAEVDRFLALSALALNGFFLLVIAGFAVPKLVHGVFD